MRLPPQVMHLYTYDLFCEKLGFKICWGCFAWYPFYYCIGVWPAVEAPVDHDIGLPGQRQDARTAPTTRRTTRGIHAHRRHLCA